MATDPLAVVLGLHQPWYDSFDQNADSWGCICNHRTGYMSAADVIEKHIVPLVRRAIAEKSEDLTSPYQRTRTNKGDREERHFWDSFEAHYRLLQKNQYTQTAEMLNLYEAERKRQAQAIVNLESQMNQLIQQGVVMGQIRAKLERAGFDLDVILQTEEIFGEESSGA